MCEIMGENIAEPDIPRMTVRLMGFGCPVTKGTNLLAYLLTYLITYSIKQSP